MSNSIRVRTDLNVKDTIVKVKLDQDFDFIEILSLKITQEEVYRKFSSNYGVVAGRVIANNGFGIENAKVSIFIPITDDDKNDPIINGIYPFENVTDTNSDGIRYNLLSRKSQGICHTPVGIIPTKREFLDDDILIEVYEKYYKLTTTTNKSGDYLIFGVPLGPQIIHMDVDISDVGIMSQRPYDMIRQGSSPKQFESPSKFKSSKDLDSLSQIKSTNIGINVQPFWGDKDNYEVGICRADINIPYLFEPSAIFIGSLFSDNDKHSVNKQCRPRKKLGNLCETVTGEGTIEMIRKTISGGVERYDVEGGRVIDDDGTWAYQIPMNLDYMITDEYGNLIPSGDPTKGVPTRADVRFRISMDQSGDEGRLRTRAAYLIPNQPATVNEADYSFNEDTTDSKSFATLKWNKIYTVKNLISRYQRTDIKNSRHFIGIKNVDNCGSHTPFPYNRIDTDFNPLYSILCLIMDILITTISLINSTIIYAINLLIGAIDTILGVISDIINLVPGVNNVNITIPSVECIGIEVDSVNYYPGCNSGSHDGENSNSQKLKDVLQLKLGDSLNLFEFDFYNDWINGILYLPLLKYKKKKNGEEKFCDYDCYTNPDNDCPSANILDTCVNENNDGVGVISLNNGVIKKDSEINYFYYPSIASTGALMFPTNLMLLGSTLECDIDGYPVIHESLTPTTYQMPEFSKEGDEPSMEPLYFSKVTCFNVEINATNRFNINTGCEIGVDLGLYDQTYLGNGDINDSTLRKQIICMNTPGLTMDDFNNITDDFRDINDVYYKSVNFINQSGGYYRYRGLIGVLNRPTGGSMYFYFGIIPGKSAIEKANSKFFTRCE